jgi:DNA-binding PadR family transcriptional regulator
VGARATGIEIYREIEERTGRDPSVPAVHVTLRRLEIKGCVRSTQGTPSPRGGRPRRHYRLTPRGTAALVSYRSMWQSLWRGLELPDAGKKS